MTDYSARRAGRTVPAPLWEWNDTTWTATWSAPRSRSRHDGRGPQRSLRPRQRLVAANIGRIRVCRYGGTHCEAEAVDPDDGTDLIDMFVAIIGGGLDQDAADKTLPSRGNLLYMIDIETGKTIYKRGCALPMTRPPASTPAASAASRRRSTPTSTATSTASTWRPRAASCTSRPRPGARATIPH